MRIPLENGGFVSDRSHATKYRHASLQQEQTLPFFSEVHSESERDRSRAPQCRCHHLDGMIPETQEKRDFVPILQIETKNAKFSEP